MRLRPHVVRGRTDSHGRPTGDTKWTVYMRIHSKQFVCVNETKLVAFHSLAWAFAYTYINGIAAFAKRIPSPPFRDRWQWCSVAVSRLDSIASNAYSCGLSNPAVGSCVFMTKTTQYDISLGHGLTAPFKSTQPSALCGTVKRV